MKKFLLVALSSILLTCTLAFAQLPAPSGLKVGDAAPDFTSTDVNGININLKQKLKKENVILLFYRGEWCPYCNKQLKNLSDSLSLITARGTTIIAITPEQKEQANKTIEKTKATFSIIPDSHSKIMNAYKVGFTADKKMVDTYNSYGINFSKNNGSNGNNLPIPAVYIINKNGKIIYRYFDTDYKNRVTVKELLKYL